MAARHAICATARPMRAGLAAPGPTCNPAPPWPHGRRPGAAPGGPAARLALVHQLDLVPCQSTTALSRPAPSPANAPDHGRRLRPLFGVSSNSRTTAAVLFGEHRPIPATGASPCPYGPPGVYVIIGVDCPSSASLFIADCAYSTGQGQFLHIKHIDVNRGGAARSRQLPTA